MSFRINLCYCFCCLCSFLSFSCMNIWNSFLCGFNNLPFLSFNFSIDCFINKLTMFFFLKFISNIPLSCWLNISRVVISFGNGSEHRGVRVFDCESSWFVGTWQLDWIGCWNINSLWLVIVMNVLCNGFSRVKMVMVFMDFFNNSVGDYIWSWDINCFPHSFFYFSFCFFGNSLFSSFSLMSFICLNLTLFLSILLLYLFFLNW